MELVVSEKSCRKIMATFNESYCRENKRIVEFCRWAKKFKIESILLFEI